MRTTTTPQAAGRMQGGRLTRNDQHERAEPSLPCPPQERVVSAHSPLWMHTFTIDLIFSVEVVTIR
jgi:hypothetical protein